MVWLLRRVCVPCLQSNCMLVIHSIHPLEKQRFTVNKERWEVLTHTAARLSRQRRILRHAVFSSSCRTNNMYSSVDCIPRQRSCPRRLAMVTSLEKNTKFLKSSTKNVTCAEQKSSRTGWALYCESTDIMSSSYWSDSPRFVSTFQKSSWKSMFCIAPTRYIASFSLINLSFSSRLRSIGSCRNSEHLINGYWLQLHCS